MQAETVREPRLVEGGTQEAAEHGLGAEMPIGRHFRVRPLTRFEVLFKHESRWYRVNFTPLLFARAFLCCVTDDEIVIGYWRIFCPNCAVSKI